MIFGIGFIAIAAGLALGVLVAYVGARRVVTALGGSRAAHIGAFFGGLLAAYPAFFLAFVVGGNLGAGYSEAYFGTPIPGLAAGIAGIFAAVTLLGSTVGAIVGRIWLSNV